MDLIRYGPMMDSTSWLAGDFPFMGAWMSILDIYFGGVLASPIAILAGL
jgi:hypothetical protein